MLNECCSSFEEFVINFNPFNFRWIRQTEIANSPEQSLGSAAKFRCNCNNDLYFDQFNFIINHRILHHSSSQIKFFAFINNHCTPTGFAIIPNPVRSITINEETRTIKFKKQSDDPTTSYVAIKQRKWTKLLLNFKFHHH